MSGFCLCETRVQGKEVASVLAVAGWNGVPCQLQFSGQRAANMQRYSLGTEVPQCVL